MNNTTVTQLVVNEFVKNGKLDLARLTIAREFDAIHREHRQYDGWLDDTELVCVVHQCRGKGGVSAEPGDYVLAKPYDPIDWLLGTDISTRTYFSVRLGWNCAVRPRYLTDIETKEIA